MEAAVATAPANPPVVHDGEAEATRSTEELFQWSSFVHVGAGAQECEHDVDGECEDPRHFHAWVCLPNQFQIRDIGDKARAAQARKRRALKDPESDSYAILENDLDALREPSMFEALLDNLAERHIERTLLRIVEELQKDDRFENHAQDSEEYRRLQHLSEEDRDPEEWERLSADMLAYGEELQKVMEQKRDAERERLVAKPVDEVIDLERQYRIDSEGNEFYLHTYYTWVMFTCTFKPTTLGFPSVRKFAKPEDLRTAPPEVVRELRETIGVLEQRTSVERGEAAGN